MLRKTSLGLIACVITSQASALEMYKAKIINLTQSTTGGITATYKNEPLQALVNRGELYYSYINSQAEPQTIPLGKFSTIESKHGIYIQNNEERTQEYTMRITSCVLDTHDDHCAFADYTISIEPDGYFEDKISPELIFKPTELKPLTSKSMVEVRRSGTTPNEPGSFESSSASSDILVTAN